MALSLSTFLGELAINKGDRVILVMQNIPQMVIACLAVWFRRAVVVPLNPMFTGEDLAHYLADCGATLFICQDDLFPAKVEKAIAGHENIEVITTSALDMLDRNADVPEQLRETFKQRHPNTHDLMDIVADGADQKPPVSHSELSDLAYLVYTSGTTGPAKGTMIRHANVVFNSVVYEKACRLDRSDVVLGVAPLFHITGIVGHMAIAFRLGIPMVLFNRFVPNTVLWLMDKHQVTFTVGAITVFIALMNCPELKNYNLSKFKKAYSGGAPVSPATVRKFQKLVGPEIHNIYGLTESTSPATVTPLGVEGPVDEETGALSVGLVIPNHEAWIVDVENPDKEIPLGEEGELVIRGPGITDGYWGKPEETAHALKKGRLFTGDVAKIDENGWCYIVDRKKDLINASGFKVWPREVEDTLYKHPAVKEAAVVGIADSYRGETVKAFVSVNEAFKNSLTPEELIQFCKERLAAYKYPRVIEIINEIPKTATGKLLRRILKNR